MSSLGRKVADQRGEEAALDRALIEGLRQGQVAAFDAVYERYRARLYGFLFRLTRDHARAEDLLQESWLKIARSAPRLREDTRLDAWLFTVARNTWISDQRWRAFDATRLLSLRWLHRDPPPSPQAAAEHKGAIERTEQALGELAPAQREILLLVGVEGFTPAEAAAIIGITAESARQRLSRARAELTRRTTGEEAPHG